MELWCGTIQGNALSPLDHFTGVDYDDRSKETAIYQIQVRTLSCAC